MLSFDLSMTNIILTVAVVGLFILFVTLLMKLNPSTDKNEDIETEVEAEGQKPLQTLPPVSQNPPQSAKIEVPKVAEKPLIAVATAVGGSSVQTKQETLAPTLNEGRDIPRQEKTLAPARTGSVPSKRDCLHHFGYLRTFPKNSPIPDECFGCEKIVDCLVSKKSK